MPLGRGPISKIVGGAIGLGQEINAHHKETKAQEAAAAGAARGHPRNDGDSSPDYDDLHGDQAQWELDEFQQEDHSDPEQTEDVRDTDKLLEQFFQKHPQPAQILDLGQLAHPVVIPQRRPSHKTRGFVRAYAPDLRACHISEKTFLDFLDGFGNAIKCQSAFNIVQLGVLAGAITVDVIAGPMIWVHVAALAVHTSVEMSRRGYVNTQTNKYLDTMNEKLFRPHGLYCMIMAYDDAATTAVQRVDLSANIIQSVAANSDGHHGITKTLKASSGKTAEFEIPESAPLVFPQLDSLSEVKKEGKMRKGMSFLADYFDRRAQASWEANHPGSALAGVAPRKDFGGRFADPTSSAAQGSVLNPSTWTGGASGAPTRGRRQQRKSKGGLKKLLSEVSPASLHKISAMADILNRRCSIS